MNINHCQRGIKEETILKTQTLKLEKCTGLGIDSMVSIHFH